jgi:hypothetical protein
VAVEETLTVDLGRQCAENALQTLRTEPSLSCGPREGENDSVEELCRCQDIELLNGDLTYREQGRSKTPDDSIPHGESDMPVGAHLTGEDDYARNNDALDDGDRHALT